MALFIELDQGDTLLVGPGSGARIILERKSGQRARLRIESDADTDIERFKAGEHVPATPKPGGGAPRAPTNTTIATLKRRAIT